jgi:amino acid transporter
MTVKPGKPDGTPPTSNPDAGQIGLVAAVSIGIGGMVGAGIFSILGVVAQAAGNMMWLAFMIGGVVALLSTYSYAKLGAVFPSAGGAVHFLVKSFGDGVLAGGLNLFMWAGYIISLALTPPPSAATPRPSSPRHRRRCCSSRSRSAPCWR